MAICPKCKNRVKNNANKKTITGTNIQVHKSCPKNKYIK